jgi:MFS family permease
VRTVGTGTIWVFSAVLLQMIVPDKYRGRVFAFEFAALTLTQSISILAAGYGLDNLGLTIDQVTLAFGLLGVIVTIIWLLFVVVKKDKLTVLGPPETLIVASVETNVEGHQK